MVDQALDVPEDVRCQLQYVIDAYPRSSILRDVSGAIVVQVPQVPLGPGWNKLMTTLLLIVPDRYPAAGRLLFAAEPDLMQGLSKPAGSGNLQACGRSWMSFCWQPTSPLDLTAPDGLWRYLKFALSRFWSV